jgi:hypothetical protein
VRNLLGYPNDYAVVSAARSQDPPSGLRSALYRKRLPAPVPIGRRPAFSGESGLSTALIRTQPVACQRYGTPCCHEYGTTCEC